MVDTSYGFHGDFDDTFFTVNSYSKECNHSSVDFKDFQGAIRCALVLESHNIDVSVQYTDARGDFHGIEV